MRIGRSPSSSSATSRAWSSACANAGHQARHPARGPALPGRRGHGQALVQLGGVRRAGAAPEAQGVLQPLVGRPLPGLHARRRAGQARPEAQRLRRRLDLHLCALPVRRRPRLVVDAVPVHARPRRVEAHGLSHRPRSGFVEPHVVWLRAAGSGYGGQGRPARPVHAHRPGRVGRRVVGAAGGRDQGVGHPQDEDDPGVRPPADIQLHRRPRGAQRLAPGGQRLQDADGRAPRICHR
mmetsp:Transcript_86193/g.263842  ORF Transcript_86193/g.263842 Transcript_86193/m.263842 type:complete len:237 (-) Transcript_86193:1395-2105(-)